VLKVTQALTKWLRKTNVDWDTEQFEQGYVNKNQPITVLFFLSRSLVSYQLLVYTMITVTYQIKAPSTAFNLMCSYVFTLFSQVNEKRFLFPTIVIAQIMFSASWETLNILMGDTYYKCKDIFGGLTLCGVLLVSKRRLWVTMHFSEIIKLQFGKEHHTFLCNLKLFFTNIVD